MKIFKRREKVLETREIENKKECVCCPIDKSLDCVGGLDEFRASVMWNKVDRYEKRQCRCPFEMKDNTLMF